ncbi:hypothetical protein Tco_0250970 [Tanacetum coccineum]
MRTRSQARISVPEPSVRQPSVESSNLEKPDNPPIVTMADNRTMAQLLEAPTEGYEDAIVIPEITANNFEIKHGLLNLVQNKQFFGNDKEDPHANIHGLKSNSTSWFSSQSDPHANRSKNNFNRGITSIQNRGNNFNQGPDLSDLGQFNRETHMVPASSGDSRCVKKDFERYIQALMQSSTSGSGTLPGNTVTNPKEDLKGITTRSGVTIQGPKAVNLDTESRNPNPEPNVSPVDTPIPKASIPFPSRRNDERRKEKANEQIEKFYEIFKDMNFEISFLDALTLMPKLKFRLYFKIPNRKQRGNLNVKWQNLNGNLLGRSSFTSC